MGMPWHLRRSERLTALVCARDPVELLHQFLDRGGDRERCVGGACVFRRFSSFEGHSSIVNAEKIDCTSDTASHRLPPGVVVVLLELWVMEERGVFARSVTMPLRRNEQVPMASTAAD
jgi:hypothetical protein